MSTDRRKYELKARAQRRRETRGRIVAATEALHREVGPARTTVADIARRAGVERLTVYNHFPRLKDLLAACQGRFLTGNPPPPLEPPPGTASDGARDALELVLKGLYGWFRSDRELEANVQHDRFHVSELDELLRETVDPAFDAAAAAHARLLAPPGRTRTRARRLVRLALEFRTWELLSAGGATDAEIAALLAACAASCSGPGPGSEETAGGRARRRLSAPSRS